MGVLFAVISLPRALHPADCELNDKCLKLLYLSNLNRLALLLLNTRVAAMLMMLTMRCTTSVSAAMIS